MYDIYFDLHDMHQLVDVPVDELSQLYNELLAVAKAQEAHEEFWDIGENVTFNFVDGVGEDIPDLDEDDFAVIVGPPSEGGYTCKHCGEIYPYAEPNLKGGGFKCWSCRNS